VLGDLPRGLARAAGAGAADGRDERLDGADEQRGGVVEEVLFTLAVPISGWWWGRTLNSSMPFSRTMPMPKPLISPLNTCAGGDVLALYRLLYRL
jgi:hypothetical protein